MLEFLTHELLVAGLYFSDVFAVFVLEVSLLPRKMLRFEQNVISSQIAFDGPGVDLYFGKDVFDLLDGVFLEVMQFGKICLHELLLVAQNLIQRGLTHQLWVLE